MNANARANGSPQAWQEVRHYLNGHRHELTRVAERLHPGYERVGATSLLTRAEWRLTDPLPLDRVALTWHDHAPAPAVTGGEPQARSALPEGSATYAQAMAEHGRPRLFENRVCYRLLGVEWPGLRFGRGSYFDAVDVGEAAAHELARARLRGEGEEGLPLRTLVGDPTDLGRRPALPAVSMLTLRRDGRTGEMTFVLHWRDPALVAHAGGLNQVMPVGVFQPAREGAAAEAEDFDLWKCVVREYSEEFLGHSELYGEAFAYDSWPFYLRMEQARAEGLVRPFVLGLGVDPLTFATDVLAVTVFEAEAFDAILGDLVEENEEGRVVGMTGIPFCADQVTRYVHEEPMQAAGAAVLELAWKHRHAFAP
ncbi:hypothetical protein AB0395_43805 [Streptosporangium sp. NPDC051023]|uniref:hypothetical protein n=1 Tax=Streptosporangium sp. NPDC051023 TaxID=3155410 RepID=UPI00344BEFE5